MLLVLPWCSMALLPLCGAKTFMCTQPLRGSLHFCPISQFGLAYKKRCSQKTKWGSHPDHQLVMWPWASYFSPLSPNFFIRIMGRVIPIFQHCYRLKIIQYNYISWIYKLRCIWLQKIAKPTQTGWNSNKNKYWLTWHVNPEIAHL